MSKGEGLDGENRSVETQSKLWGCSLMPVEIEIRALVLSFIILIIILMVGLSSGFEAMKEFIGYVLGLFIFLFFIF